MVPNYYRRIYGLKTSNITSITNNFGNITKIVQQSHQKIKTNLLDYFSKILYNVKIKEEAYEKALKHNNGISTGIRVIRLFG